MGENVISNNLGVGIKMLEFIPHITKSRLISIANVIILVGF